MIELKVAPEATRDLEGILQFSVARFGPVSAARYFDLIERTITRLREFPDSGVRYPGISPPMRYASAGSHRIFYTSDENLLTILRVLHQSMRPQSHLQN